MTDLENCLDLMEAASKHLGKESGESLSEAAERVALERNKLKEEVDRLLLALDAIRAARSMLGQLRDHVSDQACDELLSILSDEPMDKDGDLYISLREAAYQRGAEAMRETAAQNCAGEVCARQIRALPVPEYKR